MQSGWRTCWGDEIGKDPRGTASGFADILCWSFARLQQTASLPTASRSQLASWSLPRVPQVRFVSRRPCEACVRVNNCSGRSSGDCDYAEEKALNVSTPGQAQLQYQDTRSGTEGRARKIAEKPVKCFAPARGGCRYRSPRALLGVVLSSD